MRQWWDRLTFLHWPYETAVVQRLLPPGLRVDTFDGSAWVGLVPFFMRVAPRGLPALPWLLRFPETNVRTYVVGPDGSTGVWFFSLDAPRMIAVAVGRLQWRLPYCWSDMRVEQNAAEITYRCRRRWPAAARSEAVVRVGEPFDPADLSDLDHWLTARWQLFAATARGIQRGRVEHSRWPLHRATVGRLDTSLITAAGLPEPAGAPIVHWAPSVAVRVGWPERVSVA